MQVYANTPQLVNSSQSRKIAGFWRRLFAFVVDVIITIVPCMILGFTFYGLFSASPVYAHLTGLSLTILYFGILSSEAAGGQTVGQRLVKIQVVDRAGQLISVERSLLRSFILLAPIIVTGQLLPSFTAYPLERAVDFIISGAEIAIYYLYVFNTRTRQSLHDVAMGTYVVDAESNGSVQGQHLWGGHWVMLAGIAVAVALLIVGLGNVIQGTSFSELNQIQQGVLASGKVQSVAASVKKDWKLGGETQTYLVVTAVLRDKSSSPKKDAAEIADSVLRSDAGAANRDMITVILPEGFEIGFARFSRTHQFSHDPETWIKEAQEFGLRQQ
jgi:uncharacterized RDD family membrane protein YckC